MFTFLSIKYIVKIGDSRNMFDCISMAMLQQQQQKKITKIR